MSWHGSVVLSMSMEIMKQLYDVGNLVDIAEDGALIKKHLKISRQLNLNIEINQN